MSQEQGASDEDLARACQTGSLEDFEELVRRYHGRICAFALSFCRNEADARDITQETFVRAYQAIRQFDPRQAFAPWLFAIARRKSIDLLRSRRGAPEGYELETRHAEDPSMALEQEEEARDLWAMARQSLPAAQYQAVWLFYAEEMPVAQVAVALGKSQTHVKVMLLRARRALLEKFESGTSKWRMVNHELEAKGATH